MRYFNLGAGGRFERYLLDKSIEIFTGVVVGEGQYRPGGSCISCKRERALEGRPMSLVSEIEVSDTPIEIADVVTEYPNVSFEIERFRWDDGMIHWFLWISGDRLDRVTGTFQELPSAVEVELVSGGSERRLYRVTIAGNVDHVPTDVLLDGALVSGEIRPDCLHLVGHVSGRDVLAALWEFLRSNQLDIDVVRLNHTTIEQGSGRLTEPQFEALVTAYEMGYFDESERVTQDEIATELGISRSSFSERLRRAQQHLVEEQLGVA